MRHRIPIRIPLRVVPPCVVVLCLALPLAGCGPVAAEVEEAPAAAPQAAEPAAEPAPAATATVTSNANVRTGPGTDHAVAFWLTVGDAVTVAGRSADGAWLQIEHAGRAGWLFAALADLDAEARAALPDVSAPAPAVEAAAPADEPEPAPEPVAPEPADEPEPEPAPEPAPQPTPAPQPAPEPTPATPAPAAVTVTGTVVNLRTGPGTDHAADGRVRTGDRLRPTGRNAAGDWLRVMHPVATGEHAWIFAALTDLGAADRTALAVVDGQAAAAPPAAQPAPAYDDGIEDCTQWHTINPNETRLAQITDWYGLDLAAVATLNGLDPEAPLAAGTELCLPDAAVPQPPAPPAAAPAPQPAAGGPCRSAWGNPFPCPDIPDHPERAVKSVPGMPVLYHAPGTYDRSRHPGLDYDFELILGDDSTMWNWRMRDPEACWDALRVHMGDVPESIGLKRLEVRLSDPPWANDMRLKTASNEATADMEYSVSHSYPDVDWGPVLDGTGDRGDLHPDLGEASLRCYNRPRGRPDDDAFCRLYPVWGNSGSIHLEAAVNLTLADAAGQMSRRAVGYQYGFTHPVRLHHNAYVVPLIDDRSGDPAGSGPCMEVTRAG